jgi:hypothetical protein
MYVPSYRRVASSLTSHGTWRVAFRGFRPLHAANLLAAAIGIVHVIGPTCVFYIQAPWRPDREAVISG